MLYNNGLASKPFFLPARSGAVVQPKLFVNTPGDHYEQQADAMAESVIQMPFNENSIQPVTGIIGNSVQRKCASCEEEDKKKSSVMRKTDGGNGGMMASASLANSLSASKGSGIPLPASTKNFMENAFSTDFSPVRIHTDGKASAMSKGINARAFTYGSDIYFNNGQYSPGSTEGNKLLAHELTHVIQQNAASGTNAIQRQDDVAEPMGTTPCYACQIPGGLGICCPSSDMPYVQECWDKATRIIDNCPGAPSSCLTTAKCAQCQCVAEARGERYCQCTGMV